MRIRAMVVAATAAAMVGTGGAAFAQSPDLPSTATARHVGHRLHFTAQRLTMEHLDLGAPGPSAGDTTLIGGHIVSGNVNGATSADCVVVTTASGGISQCEVDFVLGQGILMTRGVGSGNDPGVTLAVVGGSGRFAGARGAGTLTPTASGSVVRLRLR